MPPSQRVGAGSRACPASLSAEASAEEEVPLSEGQRRMRASAICYDPISEIRAIRGKTQRSGWPLLEQLWGLAGVSWPCRTGDPIGLSCKKVGRPRVSEPPVLTNLTTTTITLTKYTPHLRISKCAADFDAHLVNA